MIAWDNMKVVARVAGAIDPLVRVERFGKPLGGNPQIRTFQMIATEARGKRRIANITGKIEQNGWLSANIDGSGVACQNIRVPLFVPASSGK
jgi:hypothetical protein